MSNDARLVELASEAIVEPHPKQMEWNDFHSI